MGDSAEQVDPNNVPPTPPITVDEAVMRRLASLCAEVSDVFVIILPGKPASLRWIAQGHPSFVRALTEDFLEVLAGPSDNEDDE